MHGSHNRRRPAAILAAAILACAAFAATAAALVSTSAGTDQLSVLNVGESSVTSKSTPGWTPIPYSKVWVTVPAGGAVINARFTGQSLCTHNSGSAPGLCSLKITANGVPLKPSGSFAFDSVGGAATAGPGGDESHGMERSMKLAAGNYTIQVSMSVTPLQTKFVLSYWHLAVELSAV